MTPAELFWATAFLSLLLIRVVADYVRLRLHVRGIHIHHFVWGILSAFVAIVALYWNVVYVGVFFAAWAASLIASEAKELVLQKWNR